MRINVTNVTDVANATEGVPAVSEIDITLVAGRLVAVDLVECEGGIEALTLAPATWAALMISAACCHVSLRGGRRSM